MISIIIPVFNHAAALRRCLDSILLQSYQDFEVIIVDDGSTDDLAAVLNDSARHQYGTGLASILGQPNAGAPVARNTGFAVARGEEILFLDADTVMATDMLAQLHAALLHTTTAAYAYSWYRLEGKTFRPAKFSAHRLRKGNYIHTSALIRRNSFPGFDPVLRRFQDWDLWLTMLERGHTGVCVSEVLFALSVDRPGISYWAPAWSYRLWAVSKRLTGFAPRWYRSFIDAKTVVEKKHNL